MLSYRLLHINNVNPVPINNFQKNHVQSPNIYNLLSKHLSNNKNYHTDTLLPSTKTNTTNIPAPFHSSLLALSPDQLDSTISNTFAREEAISVPAKESMGKTMYPYLFARDHSTAPMLKSGVDTATLQTLENHGQATKS